MQALWSWLTSLLNWRGLPGGVVAVMVTAASSPTVTVQVAEKVPFRAVMVAVPGFAPVSVVLTPVFVPTRTMEGSLEDQSQEPSPVLAAPKV